MPTASGAAYAATTLGGVPALECHHGGAETGGTLLYFHGGGYIAGSAKGYRGLPTALAASASLAAVAIDYRLAPEAPFPAAIDDCVAAYQALWKAASHLIASCSLAILLAVGWRLLRSSSCAMADIRCQRRHCCCRHGGAYLPRFDVRSQGCTRPVVDARWPSGRCAALSGRGRCEKPFGIADLWQSVGSSSPVDPGRLAEILLDDAVRLAGVAGADGTAVRLDVWPDMIHVWQVSLSCCLKVPRPSPMAEPFLPNILHRIEAHHDITTSDG